MPTTNKSIIPNNPHAALYAVANVWERFVGTGELNPSRLRPVIANSWLRCRDNGINPLTNRARSVISKEEVEAKLHSENLGISGKKILDRMSDTVKDTGHVIVLADNSGRIIYSVGHKQVRRHLEKINFRPGSEWNENVVGPNGIGTTLSLGQPEVVMGSEHFCQGWQPWVCYGAPIHNPSNNSLLGCIDITGSANKISVEAMALAISMTQSIESDLSVIQFRKREDLRLVYHDMQKKYSNEASLLVDEFGYVIDLNSLASTMLNSTSTVINKPISDLSPELAKTISQCVTKESIDDIEMQTSLMSDTELVIKPIKTKNGSAGCFIMMRRNSIDISTTNLRTREDELIKKTLHQTNGNISKAARILDINRATIYRRRENWLQ